MKVRHGFAVLVGMLVILPVSAVPRFQEVKANYRPSEALLLARDGRPLHSLRIDKQVRRFEWVPLAQVSPAFVRAVVLSEDQRFYEHGGVDWRAAGNAAWNNFWNTRTRGASTLTMQLAGLLDEDGQRRGRRSLFEKMSQTATALRIESSWSKKQILEAYLNLASFRGEAQGVAAMSRGLFGKWPDGLNERESALAAALLRAPNAAPTVVSKRACALLKDMQRADECRDLEVFATAALAGAFREGEHGNELKPQAPHLARKLLSEPGQKLRSTLDADLQAFATESLHRHLSALQKQNAQDGAVIVIDNASGEVMAWVGSSGDLSAAGEVDGVTALRQAGSTLKPFLYALAFEQKRLTPASLIEDAPLTLDTGNGLYAPQNYEPNYHGWVSARMALGGSLNVPAVKTLVRVGPDAFQQRLRASGFASLNEAGEWYGYSLALGSADVSVLMLANAYRTLANQGRWSPLRVTSAKDNLVPCRREGCAGVFTEKAHNAFTPAAAFMVSDILSDRSARASTFGLESWLATPYWSAAKTGTSKDMRDNWCTGYSRHYTVSVWVGNAGGDPMRDVSGVSGAAPVWREVMDWLQRGDPSAGRPARVSRAPEPPKGVVRQQIRFEGARLEPARQEWFIAGTESPVIRAAAVTSLARIAYPSDGAILALDPDIPPQNQKLRLRLSAPAKAGWLWRMDGHTLGAANREQRWLPQPGRHRLALFDRKGKELDAVSFEVRALRKSATMR